MNKIHQDTIWKLVEAKCRKLNDATSSSQVAFFLSLTWAFIWAWNLYPLEFGYINTYRERYVVLNQIVEDSFAQARIDCPKNGNGDLDDDTNSCRYLHPSKQLVDVCKSVVNIPAERTVFGVSFKTKNFLNVKYCINTIKNRLTIADKQYEDNGIMSFPAGFGRLDISDLNIMGNIGLLLLLTWSFYGIRGENNAIKALVKAESFVDPKDADATKNRHLSSKFILRTEDKKISGQHLVVAYSSVSRGFISMFSEHSKSNLFAPIALIILPIFVPLVNLVTDIRALTRMQLEQYAYAQVGVEIVIIVAISILTLRNAMITKNTSMLLNGWRLAAAGVWAEAWDEDQNAPAPAVLVDQFRGSATRWQETS